MDPDPHQNVTGLTHDCVLCARSEAYDEGNLEHEVQLLDLWRLLQPDRQLDKEREGSTPTTGTPGCFLGNVEYEWIRFSRIP